MSVRIRNVVRTVRGRMAREMRVELYRAEKLRERRGHGRNYCPSEKEMMRRIRVRKSREMKGLKNV